MNIFGERIKKLRKENHFTQDYVSERIKISHASISQYESGDREPSFDILVAFALLYGTSTDYLLGLTDNPSPTTSEISLDATGLDEAQITVVKKVVSNFKEINEKLEQTKSHKA